MRCGAILTIALVGASALADEPDEPMPAAPAASSPSPAEPLPPAEPPPLPPPSMALPPPPPPALDLAALDRLEASGRRMRGGGLTLLIVGVASELTGQILVLHSQLSNTQTCITQNGTTTCSSDYPVSELISGVVLGLAGGGMIYGGTALLSSGGARVRRAQALRARFQPVVSTRGAGATLSLVF